MNGARTHAHKIITIKNLIMQYDNKQITSRVCLTRIKQVVSRVTLESDI